MVSLLTSQQLLCQPESLSGGTQRSWELDLCGLEVLVTCVEDPGYLVSLGLKSAFL